MFGIVTLALGCGRGFEYEGGEPVDTAVTIQECGADLDLEAGINIAGVAVDAETGLVLSTKNFPKRKGALCMSAVNPAPALGGAPPEYLATSQLCDDGSFIIPGIGDVPSIGVMVEVADCQDEGTVSRTVTGVRSEAFDGLGPGDTLEEITAYSVSSADIAVLQSDLEGYGFKGSLAKDGYLSGFVRDSEGNPVSGAQVTCGICGSNPTYYRDGALADGVFGDGTTANSATDADGEGYFIVPGAPITTYTCEDGGDHKWQGRTYGSISGFGVFINFLAD